MILLYYFLLMGIAEAHDCASEAVPNPLVYDSNTVNVVTYEPELKAYFGQLHAHTGLSDGKGDPKEAFTEARKRGLDFFAVTDHLEYLWLHKNRWKLLKEQATEATEKGKFVAIPGFEWGGVPTIRGWMNHINILFPDKILQPARSLKSLYESISKLGPNSIGKFNHPGMKKFKAPLNQTNWYEFKYSKEANQFMRLIRIDSVEENNEKHHEINGYIPALDKGWQVSPVTSEDNHKSNWGHLPKRTGIWAKELSPEGVASALKSLTTFYTDDSNASVMLVADDKWLMGSTIQVDGKIRLSVRAYDKNFRDRVATVELVTFQGRVVERSMGGHYPFRAEFEVNPKTDAYYYVTVLQTDGDRLISAPIFVDRK